MANGHFKKNSKKLNTCKIYYLVLLFTELDFVFIKNDRLASLKYNMAVFRQMTPFILWPQEMTIWVWSLMTDDDDYTRVYGYILAAVAA